MLVAEEAAARAAQEEIMHIMLQKPQQASVPVMLLFYEPARFRERYGFLPEGLPPDALVLYVAESIDDGQPIEVATSQQELGCCVKIIPGPIE